jgi:hypothetical protein
MTEAPGKLTHGADLASWLRLSQNSHGVRTDGVEGRRKVPVVSGSSTTSAADATSHSGRRARVAARTRLDFWFDAVILVGYTIAYSYGFTGVVIHEWLGIGLGRMVSGRARRSGLLARDIHPAG